MTCNLLLKLFNTQEGKTLLCILMTSLLVLSMICISTQFRKQLESTEPQQLSLHQKILCIILSIHKDVFKYEFIQVKGAIRNVHESSSDWLFTQRVTTVESGQSQSQESRKQFLPLKVAGYYLHHHLLLCQAHCKCTGLGMMQKGFQLILRQCSSIPSVQCVAAQIWFLMLL